VSSTTIRYSGVPENSHSRGLGSETDTDLTVRWRSRLRDELNTTTGNEPSAPGTAFIAGFTPGKAGPTSADPRHNPAYPHPQNPGLIEESDGFHDWVGRRLFLSDGSPDPMTPGAYRYQTRPDLCDLDAPDSAPASPRYEPDHLRHRPGDTWLIDRNRPHDVLDPGPFGSPGWFPDRRTGRHRRDELPDPIPWWEIEEEPEKREWAEHSEALLDRRTRDAEAADSPPRSGKRHPEPPADSNPRPPRRYRYRDEEPAMSEPPQPFHFDKLREDAWDRFLTKSEPLAAASRANLTALERECGWQIATWVRFFRWLVVLVRSLRRAQADPGPDSTAARLVPSQRGSRAGIRRTVVAADRHTYLAARTARFSQAVRGAQRARAEAPQAPANEPTPEEHWWGRPSEARLPRERQRSAAPFITEWERLFDTHRLTGLSNLNWFAGTADGSAAPAGVDQRIADPTGGVAWA
jgi:hypothetical protein